MRKGHSFRCRTNGPNGSRAYPFDLDGIVVFLASGVSLCITGQKRFLATQFGSARVTAFDEQGFRG